MFKIPNGTNENWQKSIGGHRVWAKCSVQKGNANKYLMSITISFRDRNNFDRNKADLGSGTPDSVNGRFEELGWARSFETYGSIHRVIMWTGKCKNTNITIADNGGQR